MNNKDAVIQGSVSRQPMASAEVVKDVSEFARIIIKKYNGRPELMMLAKLVFSDLTETVAEFERDRRNMLRQGEREVKKDYECDCADCRALSKFIEDFKKIGADVHVVKIDK